MSENSPGGDTPVSRYEPSASHTEERGTVRVEWARDRAKWGLYFISLLAGDQQAEGLRVWGELERAHGAHASELQTAWHQELQRAYEAGQQHAYGLLKTREDVAVASTPKPNDPDATIVH